MGEKGGKPGVTCKISFFNNLQRQQYGAGVLVRTVLIASFVACVPQVLSAQHSGRTSHHGREQSEFNSEQDIGPVQRPVQLGSEALRALRNDGAVTSCIEDDESHPQQPLASWFVGSEIHLGGTSGPDLVVLPKLNLGPAAPDEGSQSVCFLGANIAQFWVLHKTRTGFALVLSQVAHNLEVLTSRTNGLRDIELASAVGASYYGAIDYRFDGHFYEIVRRSSGSIGAEVPSDLSGYETRAPLLQSAHDSSEAIRAKARAWIWKRWRAHKPSYVRVRTAADDGGEEDRTYYVNGSDDDWHVLVKTHRIVTEPNSFRRSNRKVIEDALFVADEVERVCPTAKKNAQGNAFADDRELPSTAYKLRLSDHAGRFVAIL
jgi:hypothetical protein